MAKEKKKKLTQKLDTFDYLSISLWFAILIPGLQLPLDASFSFPRTLFFIIWISGFFIYIARRILVEKRLFFYSSSLSNVAVITVGLALILSFVLSVSQIDSLFGYNLSFTTSSLFLLALPLLYALLRVAGLSLEFQVSRLLTSLPISLLVVDVLAVILYLVPQGWYETIFGAYSQYFLYLTLSPFALLGTLSQSALIHIFALIVLIFQFASVKISKGLKPRALLKMITGLVLTTAGSYLFFTTLSTNFSKVLIYVTIVIALVALAFLFKKKERKSYVLALSSILTLFFGLGLLWTNLDIVANGAVPEISHAETTAIIKSAFLGSGVPLWRTLTGFGVGTFPYLFLQYRNLNTALIFGSETFMYKPTSVFAELFVEQGILGLTAFLFLMFGVVRSFIIASRKKILGMEFALLVSIFAIMIVSPSFIFLYVLLFVALAAYFDKFESMPEQLQTIRAISVKESLYTNRSVDNTAKIFMGIAIVSALTFAVILAKPGMTLVGYSRALLRYNVASTQQVNDERPEAAQSYLNAYGLASSYTGFCEDCSQLTLLQTTSMLRVSALYSGLTEEERANSAEFREIRDSLVQLTTSLTEKNRNRYDYWLISSQVYRDISVDENTQTIKSLALSSTRNALKLNPYSVTAYYNYIDILMSLGNDSQINTEIADSLQKLKQVVGSPLQVQILDGIMYARFKDYDTSIKVFEKIKEELSASELYSDEDKTAIVALVEKHMSDVTQLKDQQATATVQPAIEENETEEIPIPSVVEVTPTATPTEEVSEE